MKKQIKESVFKLTDLERHIEKNKKEIFQNMKTYGVKLKDLDSIGNYMSLASVLGIDSRLLKDVDIDEYAGVAADVLSGEPIDYEIGKDPRESKQFKLANIAKKILKENSNELDKLFNFLDHPWQEDGEIEFVSLLDQNRGNFKTSNWMATLRYLRDMDKANSNLSMMASDKFLNMWDDLIK